MPLTPPSDDRNFSDVLEDIGERPDPTIKLGEVVTEFEERGFGAMLLLLGLLSAVIGFIPGSTTVLGIPMLLIGLQLLVRRDQPWFPRAALNAPFDRGHFRSGVARALKPLRFVERLSRPRLEFMSTDLSEMLIGLAVIVLALILMLPLIGFNLVPSLVVLVFGFGLTQRDGAIMLVGWAGMAGFMTFCWLAWELVSNAIHYSWGVATSLFG